VRAGDLGDDPALLRPCDEVVDQHPEPSAPVGRELPHQRRQVVHAVERLDDDPLDPQVVPPHPLDELRVVLALHPDPAATRDPRGEALHRHRAARRTAGGPVDRDDRPGEGDRLALEQEHPEREHPDLAVPVLQADVLLVAGDDRAAPAAEHLLDHQARLGRHRRGRLPHRRREVDPVVAAHPSTLGSAAPTPP